MTCYVCKEENTQERSFGELAELTSCQYRVRERREREVERAGLEPTAAAPSQPDYLEVIR